MRSGTALIILLAATYTLVGLLAVASPAKADGRTLLGYGVNLAAHPWNLQAYKMRYDVKGCSRLCESNGRCVAWQLQGNGSQTWYTCRLLDRVRSAPRPMRDTFFGFSSRYR